MIAAEPVFDEAATVEAMPRVLPPGWLRGREAGWDDNGFVNHRQRLGVIVTVDRHSDGKRWLHVSVSHRNRLPNWDELRWVKDLFIGRDRKALQVLPPEAEYVNVHPHCLHLWCCLDGDPLPDFRRGGTI